MYCILAGFVVSLSPAQRKCSCFKAKKPHLVNNGRVILSSFLTNMYFRQAQHMKIQYIRLDKHYDSKKTRSENRLERTSSQSYNRPIPDTFSRKHINHILPWLALDFRPAPTSSRDHQYSIYALEGAYRDAREALKKKNETLEHASVP
jgi:hypothetical protein